MRQKGNVVENTTLSSDTGKPCSYYVIEKRGFPV